MPWQEYINLELLKLMSHHVSGALGMIVGFWLVGSVAERIVSSGLVLTFIHTFEMVVVVAGLFWLMMFVLVELGGMLIRLIKEKKLFATLAG